MDQIDESKWIDYSHGMELREDQEPNSRQNENGILKNYLVYIVKFPNNKCYIGISKKSLKERKRKHYGDARRGSSLAIHKALLKYEGQEVWKVLQKNLYKKEALSEEIRLITLYESRVKSGKGYNITAGGEGVRDYSPSKKTRLKMRKAKLGKVAPKRSTEWRDNISKSKIGAKNGMYKKIPFNKGVSHKKWLTEKGLEKYNKSRNKMKKRIEMMSLNKTSLMCFYSITDATNYVSLKTKSAIVEAIKRDGTSAGYRWRYI